MESNNALTFDMGYDLEYHHAAVHNSLEDLLAFLLGYTTPYSLRVL